MKIALSIIISDFQAGGHNKNGNPVIILNNNFKGFVNFFDCWYENEVTICNNNFLKGTNILGKPNNISVTFYKKPIIKDNIGQLDLDNEEKVSLLKPVQSKAML